MILYFKQENLCWKQIYQRYKLLYYCFKRRLFYIIIIYNCFIHSRPYVFWCITLKKYSKGNILLIFLKYIVILIPPTKESTCVIARYIISYSVSMIWSLKFSIQKYWFQSLVYLNCFYSLLCMYRLSSCFVVAYKFSVCYWFRSLGKQ